jgi:nitroimidazol reductase NimA-like FMN-containing flavoprotein (pyridoxamine 5'-phosphate oxidase superfamily)
VISTDHDIVPYVKEMVLHEIEQFLTCARIERIGVSLKEGPYVVPVGYVYSEGKVFLHTCRTEGIKMQATQANSNVCFEVDESISDGSLAKSVVILGHAEVIEKKATMFPYLKKLIDKYRVPVSLDEYLSRRNRNIKEELDAVRICLITPYKITGKKIVRPKATFNIA